MSLSETIQDALLNWLRGAPFPAPGVTLHLSYHLDEPNVANEVSARFGGRTAFSGAILSPPFTGAGGLRMVTNLSELLSGPAEERLRVRNLGVWSAETRGSLWFTAQAVPELVVDIGSAIVLEPQALQLRAVA